jgi:hypothetical protein
MELLMKLQQPGTGSAPFIEEQEQLHEWLSAASSVVVVDDAIDTGVTMRRLVATIQSAGPSGGQSVGQHRRIMTFALTSTLGLKVHESQHHLFEGVVEYVEGDLGLLDEAATAQVLATFEPAGSSGAARLEARLQDLLLRPPHECVARALVHALETSGRRMAGLRLRIRCALWGLGRPPADDVMDELHRRYEALSGIARQVFGAALATEFCVVRSRCAGRRGARGAELIVRSCTAAGWQGPRVGRWLAPRFLQQTSSYRESAMPPGVRSQLPAPGVTPQNPTTGRSAARSAASGRRT